MHGAISEGSTMTMGLDSLPDHLLLQLFGLLDVHDLGRCTGVCQLWRSLITSSDAVWRRLYSIRWQVTHHDSSTSWYQHYGTRMQQIKNWSGRYQTDHLHGHTAGVKCAKLLPRHNLLATGSLDKTLKLWDLSTGMPIATSKSQGGTVRCLALDDQALLSGSSDHNIRVWLPSASELSFSSASASSKAGRQSRQGPLPLFNISGPANLQLVGHTGPVSAMCLTEHTLYSGSWDYCVRLWDRASWKCTSVLSFDDWVGSLVVRGNHLLVAAGPAVVVHDTCTGQVIRKFQDLHEGHVTCLEGTHNGRLMFTGSTDGLVLAHDLRMKEATTVLWHHNASVQGLTHEDPWLTSASADGTLTMINTQHCMSHRAGSARSSTYGGVGLYGRCLTPFCRQFHTSSGPAMCVDMADGFLVCGAEMPVVRVWDFTHAAEAAARAEAAKQARHTARAARHLTSSQRSQGWPQEQAGPAGEQAVYHAGSSSEQVMAQAGGAGVSKRGRRRRHAQGAHSGTTAQQAVAMAVPAVAGSAHAEGSGPGGVQEHDVLHVPHNRQRTKRGGGSHRHRPPQIPAYVPAPQPGTHTGGRHAAAGQGSSSMHLLPLQAGAAGGVGHVAGRQAPARDFTYLQLTKASKR